MQSPKSSHRPSRSPSSPSAPAPPPLSPEPAAPTEPGRPALVLRADPELQRLHAEARALRGMPGVVDVEFMRALGIGALRAGVEYMKAKLEGRKLPAAPLPLQVTGREKEVMTADEVAAFLGVDRNTVYDYAGRGVIPHQRLGKRILFHRAALVSWLDASCKAASTRKG